VRIATARSFSAVIATAVTSIVLMVVPIMRDPLRCAGQPGATVQLAAGGTVMRIDSDGFGRVNEKK